MRILSFNTISSTLSQMNEKNVQALSEQHKKIALTVAAALSLLAVLGLCILARNYWKARSIGKEAEKLHKEGHQLNKEEKSVDAKIKLEDAEKKFREALSYRPSHVFNLIHYGNTLRDQSKYVDSGDQYKKVLNSDPNNIQALKNLGKLFAVLGQLKEAEEQFKRAKDAKLNGNITLYTKKDASVLKRLAKVLIGQQKYEEATNNLKEASTICPKDSSILKIYSKMLSARFFHIIICPGLEIATQNDQQNLELAEKCYQEYLKVAPDDFPSWAIYEQALRKLGKLQEAKDAKKSWEKAEASHPAVVGYGFLARTYWKALTHGYKPEMQVCTFEEAEAKVEKATTEMPAAEQK